MPVHRFMPYLTGVQPTSGVWRPGKGEHLSLSKTDARISGRLFLNDFAWQHFLRPYSLCYRAFVALIQYNPTMQLMQQAMAKAQEKPVYPPGFKPQRLATGYSFVKNVGIGTDTNISLLLYIPSIFEALIQASENGSQNGGLLARNMLTC